MTTIDQETGMVVSEDHAIVTLGDVEMFLATQPPVQTAKELRDRLSALCEYYKGKVDVYNEVYAGQLRTERYIGQLLANVVPHSGGRPEKNGNTMLPFSTLDDLGFTKMQSSRLQQLAAVPEDRFNRYIEAKKDATERIVKADLLDPKGMSQAMNVLTRQNTVEWYTPPDIIERARTLLGGIDLDPASNATAQQWIKASKYYTAETPAGMSWAGRVWLNPPFDDADTWVDRLDSEYVDGDVTAAVLLVNSAPGYIWWEDLWRRRPVCMLRERVCFWTDEGAQYEPAKKGTTIAYYGNDVITFKQTFSAIGRVILPEE